MKPEQFLAVADLFPDAALLLTADGTVLAANRTTTVLGLPPEHVTGRALADLTATSADALRDYLRLCCRGPGPVDGSIVLLAGPGREVPCQCRASAVPAGPGETRILLRLIPPGQKIEEALRQSEERFARFMQHLPGLAWIKDVQGRYVYANEAAMRAFRRPREALYGKTDDEVFPPETAAQFQANDRQALASAAGVQVVETLAHEDGVVHHSLVSKFPIPGQGVRAALVGGMAIDITEHRRAEIENARLYQAVREADRRKDEFLALLGHELRNPLAPIRNALHVLKLPGADAAIATRAREMMERQVEHVVRLVDDLLDVSRIMRGKVELRREPVELATVVARAVETAQPALDAEGHRLTLALPAEALWVHGDLVRLAQVVGNLLHNAAKFTERGGQVWVTAAAEVGKAVLRVRDSGIGIAPELLPRLFDMFFQAERRTRNSQGGLGIGLSLVRGLVELHGGTAEAHSAGPGAGSEFVVRLPRLVPDEPRDAPRDPPGEKVQGKPAARRVLVVDDNVDAADSLAMLLRLQGHEVLVAYDGPSALAQAEAAPPAIAFLDLGMPRMDGYELARELRARPALQGVLLVAVTGWGQPEDRRRTREAGFDHHLVKPVEPEALGSLFTAEQASRER